MNRREFNYTIARATIGGGAIASILPLTSCGGSEVTAILEDIITAAGAILDVGFPQFALIINALPLNLLLVTICRNNSPSIKGTISPVANPCTG